jgi:hypothetical protein
MSSAAEPARAGDASQAGPTQAGQSQDWTLVLGRWERLRVLFNLLVGAVGLWGVSIQPARFAGLVVDCVIFGVLANVFYCFGPTAELYLRWFGLRWRGTTGLLFLLGLSFSLLLTASVAVVVAGFAGVNFD